MHFFQVPLSTALAVPRSVPLRALSADAPYSLAFPTCVTRAGTIGHVAHGKSTVVKAISGVQTVRFKNELERNITIKLGYANAKIYKCSNANCERPACYKAHSSSKEDSPPCSMCNNPMDLVRGAARCLCAGLF